jgi:hypothetical protein
MHGRLASIVLAGVTLAAAPSALARNAVTISPSLLGSLSASSLTSDVVRKDSRRSCQAGASRSRGKLPGPSGAAETERRNSTVACEQPPRSQPKLSGALSSAEAGALATAG